MEDNATGVSGRYTTHTYRNYAVAAIAVRVTKSALEIIAIHVYRYQAQRRCARRVGGNCNSGIVMMLS